MRFSFLLVLVASSVCSADEARKRIVLSDDIARHLVTTLENFRFESAQFVFTDRNGKSLEWAQKGKAFMKRMELDCRYSLDPETVIEDSVSCEMYIQDDGVPDLEKPMTYEEAEKEWYASFPAPLRDPWRLAKKIDEHFGLQSPFENIRSRRVFVNLELEADESHQKVRATLTQKRARRARVLCGKILFTFSEDLRTVTASDESQSLFPQVLIPEKTSSPLPIQLSGEGAATFRKAEDKSLEIDLKFGTFSTTLKQKDSSYDFSGDFPGIEDKRLQPKGRLFTFY